MKKYLMVIAIVAILFISCQEATSSVPPRTEDNDPGINLLVPGEMGSLSVAPGSILIWEYTNTDERPLSAEITIQRISDGSTYTRSANGTIWETEGGEEHLYFEITEGIGSPLSEYPFYYDDLVSLTIVIPELNITHSLDNITLATPFYGDVKIGSQAALYDEDLCLLNNETYNINIESWSLSINNETYRFNQLFNGSLLLQPGNNYLKLLDSSPVSSITGSFTITEDSVGFIDSSTYY